MLLAAFYWMIPLLFLLALVFVGVSIGARREPDPGGRCPYAIYLLAVIFIAILTSFLSVAGIGSKAVELVVSDYEGSNPSMEQSGGGVTEFVNLYEDTRSQDVSSLVTYVLLFLAAMALLVWHWNRLAELKNESTFPASSAERTYSAFVYLILFAALLVLTTAAVFTLLGLGDAVFPEDLAGGPGSVVRDAAYAEIVASLLAGGAALVAFRHHWAEGTRIRSGTLLEPELE